MVCNYVLLCLSQCLSISVNICLMLVLFLPPLFNCYFKPMTKGNDLKTHYSVVLDDVFLREQLIMLS